MINNKVLRISHIDLDGVSNIVCDKLHNIDFDDTLLLNYDFWDNQETLNYIKSFGKVVITDLSFSEEFFHELIDSGIYVSCYDHHTTSDYMADLPKSDMYEVFHDESRCGTKIYFEEFILKNFSRIKKAERYFVELVDVYDLWQKDSPLWEEANNLTRVLFGMSDWKSSGYLAKEKFINQQVKKIRRLPEWKWLDSEQKIIDIAVEKERIALEESEAKLDKRVDSKNQSFGTFCLGGKISITATRILENHKDLKYLIIQNSFGGLNSKISIRSRDEKEFNCLDLQIAHGHKEAAGGEFKNNTEAKQFLEGDIYCLAYQDEFEESGRIYHYLDEEE